VWRDQLDGLAEDITAWTGNDARVLELSAGQARIALAEGQQVVEDVRGHGVVVHGPSDDLARRLGSAATPA
jgi:ribulose-5-phosphate 4-epimerase/fuculose-1-phosphate aldolase